jgi:hypothetical protein
MQIPWWWRDAIALAQLQVVLGVIGALLATVAVIYAYRVAQQQFRMMEEQNEAAKRQEAIAKRQGEIAETQHKMLMEQAHRRSHLKLQVGGSRYAYTDDSMTVHSYDFEIELVNEGTKPAEDVYFRIAVPSAGPYRATIDLRGDTKLIAFDENSAIDVDPKARTWTRAVELEGRHSAPVYPGSSIPVAWVRFEIPHPENMKYEIDEAEYTLRCADGSFPADGAQKFVLDRFAQMRHQS